MTTRTATKILALNMSTMVSMALFSLVVVGMQTAPAPELRSIELPTVVVIGHKSVLPAANANATARVKASQPKNT
ncbi:MAG: hypothetical protein Q7T69_09740 [Rhodoferax sp.]|nr:hypothetical protein [Rhodoferax sp.]